MLSHELKLPMWAGYRAGPTDSPFNGEVEVTFHGKTPTPAQIAALDTARTHAVRMQETLLSAIVAAYPTLREWQDRPKAITKAELRDHVQLYEVVVTTQERDGEAYLGYLFACDWDPSGFVVLAHRDRIVSVGGFEVLEYPLVDAQASASPAKAAMGKDRGAAADEATKQRPREAGKAETKRKPTGRVPSTPKKAPRTSSKRRAKKR